MRKRPELPPYPPEPTHEEITAVIEVAALRYGLSIEDIIGPRKFTAEVRARHQVINELRAKGCRLKTIGLILHMDHSGILHHLPGGRLCKCLLDLPNSTADNHDGEAS
jgi:hypothetical protein